MFLIRKEQLDHFRAKGTKRYVERLADWLLERFHPQCEAAGLSTRTKVLAFAEEATRKAQLWGFDVELDTTQLALILLRFGLDARESVDFIDPILRDRGLVPIGKVRKILSEARRRELPGVDEVDITRVELSA